MLKNYFKVAFRNILKHRDSSMAKIFALTVGMACCIIVFSLIKFESSFDDYHDNSERIYRVNLIRQNSADRAYNGNNFYPLGAAIRSEVSGVESVTSVHCERSYTFKFNNNLFQSKFAFFVDNEYPGTFDVEWIAGNPNTSLSRPNTAAVTKDFADNFLGGMHNALNNVITFNGKQDLVITGVLATPPSNTDHPYTMLISYSSLETYLPQSINNWELVDKGSTYILLPENSNLDKINEQINKLIPKYINEETAQYTSFSLMRLGDLHDRNGNFNNYNYEFPFPLMIILSVLAFVVLLASCINYINLTTAESVMKANEVGIRKTFGAQRVQLAIQFLSETFIVTSFSFVLAVVLARVAMSAPIPILNGGTLRTNFFDGFQFPIMFALLIVLVSFFSGLYPALVLSKMKPISILRSTFLTGQSKGRLRKGLILVQFSVVQILILVALIQLNQINFMRDKPLGYNNQNVVTVTVPKFQSKHAVLIRELSSVSSITNVSYQSEQELEQISLAEDHSLKSSAATNEVDENFITTLGFELILGKGFTSQSKTGEVIVNETLLNSLNIPKSENSMGRIISIGNQTATIVGVTKDFHPKGGLSPVQPYAFKFAPAGENTHIVFAKIEDENIPATLSKIEMAWKRTYPEDFYNFIFLDDWYDSQFNKFNSFLNFLYLFCGLTIVIGGLGLYSFITFISHQRTKEIGIRKILGASSKNILWLMNKEVIRLIIVSFMISAVVSYFLANSIIQEFVEKRPIGVLVFIVELGLTFLLVTIITISKSLTAANSNPVKSLRT